MRVVAKFLTVLRRFGRVQSFARKPLIFLPGLLSVEVVLAQEKAGTLVRASRVTFPDSVPLTRVQQLTPRTDGSFFFIDALTEGVLAFDAGGGLRRIGGKGEGPGELLTPWRLGLLGPDTLWVADAARPRINLYDAATGASLADFGPSVWAGLETGGVPPRPLAVLSDRSIVALAWVDQDVTAEVRAYRVMEPGGDHEGWLLAALDLRDRTISVPLPAGGRGLQLRNPFSHSDMVAVGSFGEYVAVVRRPEPAEHAAFFTLERHRTLGRGIDSIRVAYEPRALTDRDVRAWAAELGAIRRMVDLGVFPSRAVGIDAVLAALDEPGHYPPVMNLGAGIVDEAILIDPGGAIWLQAPETDGQANRWFIVSGPDQISIVTAPREVRLLAVRGLRVWGETRDGFGAPTIHVFRVEPVDP